MRKNAEQAKERQSVAKSVPSQPEVSLKGYATEKIKQGAMKEIPTDGINMNVHTNAPTTIIDLQSPKGSNKD